MRVRLCPRWHAYNNIQLKPPLHCIHPSRARFDEHSILLCTAWLQHYWDGEDVGVGGLSAKLKLTFVYTAVTTNCLGGLERKVSTLFCRCPTRTYQLRSSNPSTFVTPAAKSPFSSWPLSTSITRHEFVSARLAGAIMNVYIQEREKGGVGDDG